MKARNIALLTALMLMLAACGNSNGAQTSPSATTPATANSATPESTTANTDTPAATTPAATGKPAGTGSSNSDLPAFETLDIDAKAYSSANLADQKLTMVNFWGTYCGPCKAEMPDLGNLSRNLPEGSQLWGVVIDAYDEDTILIAREIVEDSKADYPHLLLDEGLYAYMDKIRAVPTTVFFDSDGNQVGDVIEGMRSEDDYRSEIEKRLADL